MKHLVGWAVFYRSLVTDEYELDKVYLDKESALEREVILKKMSFDTEIEKTQIMIKEDWKEKYNALCDRIEYEEGWDPRKED